jgi:hypothetical protein
MTAGFATEAAALFEETRAGQDLAQFEPDPDGYDGAAADAGAGNGDESQQWVVWPDASDESAWAEMELRVYGAGG